MKKLPPIEAFIFDMDGLIIDSEPVYRNVWQAACAEQGFTLTNEEHSELKGRGRKGALEQIQKIAAQKSSNIDISRLLPAIALFEAKFFGEEPLPVKTGLTDLLFHIESLCLPKGVGTSASRATAERCLSQAGVRDRFHTVVGSDEVQSGKPNPDIFLEVAMRLGTDPSRCLVLEDSEPGVEAAKAAGMLAIRIPDGIPYQNVSSKADLILPDLSTVIELI
jgi:beta-phosphoglucomutase-like phosphatase (HAD superfamily)